MGRVMTLSLKEMLLSRVGTGPDIRSLWPCVGEARSDTGAVVQTGDGRAAKGGGGSGGEKQWERKCLSEVEAEVVHGLDIADGDSRGPYRDAPPSRFSTFVDGGAAV